MTASACTVSATSCTRTIAAPACTASTFPAIVPPMRSPGFDGETESLDPATLTLGDDGVVHCRVRDGAFEARFSRHAQVQLAPLLVDGGDGTTPRLRIGGRDFPLPPRPRR